MKFFLKQGPRVNIKIYASSGFVTCTELFLSQGPHFACDIISKDLTESFACTIKQWMEAYCSGKEANALPMLFKKQSLFLEGVLCVLKTIPFGHVKTYKEVAALVKKPKAARAIGKACGQNLFPLLIPCHRVVKSSGELGGFSMGDEVKKSLIDFERITPCDRK